MVGLRTHCGSGWAVWGLLLGLSTVARAGTPVSVGNVGAVQRANLSAAGPGSVNPEFDPVREEPGRFKLQWLFPFVCASSELPAPWLSFCAGNQSIDDADSIAPVYFTPDGAPDPGAASYWAWLWPILPQVVFGGGFQDSYEVQFGVIATSMGHGTLVRNFTNSPNTSYRRPGGYLSLRTGTLKMEAMIADVLAPATLVAGRIELRPLTLLYGSQIRAQPVEFDHDRIAEPYTRWKTAVSFAGDMVAPYSITDNNFKVARGPFDVAATPGDELRPIAAVGWDNEFVAIERGTSEIIGYVDVNMLWTPFHPVGPGSRLGLGAHAGARFNAQAGQLRFRFEAEGNVAGPGYVPGYFDQMYVIERDRLIGNNVSKAYAEAPASFGYLYRLSFSYLPYINVFLEGIDQFPADVVGCSQTNQVCGNSGRLTSGLSVSWLLFGGTLSVSQSGVQNYFQEAFFGPGFTLLAEGRMTLFFSYLQMLSRFYVVSDPVTGGPAVGGFLGLEVNLSL